MTIRNIILKSMARAFWACCYADWWDEFGNKSDPHAGPGEDWIEMAPPTPDSVYEFAIKFCQKLEKLHDKNVEDLYECAAKAPGKHYKDPCPDDFGHYIAMMAMGHGVSWFDDHPEFHYEPGYSHENDMKLALTHGKIPGVSCEVISGKSFMGWV